MVTTIALALAALVGLLLLWRVVRASVRIAVSLVALAALGAGVWLLLWF